MTDQQITTASSTAISPRISDYFLMLLLLCMSGNPVFVTGGRNEIVLLGAAGLLTLLLLTRQRLFITWTGLATVGAFVGILLAQSVMFSFFPIVTVMGFCIKLYVAFATVSLVKNFPRLFVNTLTGLAVVSLCFYGADSLMAMAGISLRSLLYIGPIAGETQQFHILIHNFTFSSGKLPFRNPGIFWEPGALAGYTLIAIIFLGFIRNQFRSRAYAFRLIALIACIITTFSTMGYVLLPIALLLHLRLDLKTRQAAAKQLLLGYVAVMVIVLASVGMSRLSFVGQKISNQFTAATQRLGGSQINRFGSMLFDLEYIKRRPLLGWGLHKNTRWMLHPGDEAIGMGHGNGLSDFIAKFGLVGMTIFLVAVWQGLGAMAKGHKLQQARGLALVLILAILIGETFLLMPMFLSLMFLREGSDPLANRMFLFAPKQSAPGRFLRPAFSGV